MHHSCGSGRPPPQQICHFSKWVLVRFKFSSGLFALALRVPVGSSITPQFEQFERPAGCSARHTGAQRPDFPADRHAWAGLCERLPGLMVFVLALTHTDSRLLSNRMTNKAGTPSAKNLERGVSSPSRDPSIAPSHFSFLVKNTKLQQYRHW